MMQSVKGEITIKGTGDLVEVEGKGSIKELWVAGKNLGRVDWEESFVVSSDIVVDGVTFAKDIKKWHGVGLICGKITVGNLRFGGKKDIVHFSYNNELK